MKNLSNDEKKSLSQQLKKKFNCDEVEYLGYLRFALINFKRIRLESSDYSRIRTYRLADEKCNLIRLNDEYNFIAGFIAGVAEVWNQIDYQTRKRGLIDKNGKELLPVIYDGVNAHGDGIVYITKDGETKTTSIIVLESGEYTWDDPFGMERIRTQNDKE